MKSQTRRFIAYLNILGVKINSTEFESRVKAQKLAYITQKITNKPLYDFNFYIKGPYSPELAKEYFDCREDFENGNSGGYRMLREETEELERVKPLLNALSLNDLEIVASLLYIREKGLDENQAEIRLKELKPRLKIEDIWKGTNTLKKLLLTDKLKATIMGSLDKETEEWDSVSNESLQKVE